MSGEKPQNDNRMPITEMPTMLMNQAKEQMQAYIKKMSKYLKAYVVLTLICYVLDLISFFVGVSHFTTKDDHEAYYATILLAYAAIYCTTDMYYIIWCISVYMKLPKDIASAAAKMAGGYGDKAVLIIEAKRAAMAAKKQGGGAASGDGAPVDNSDIHEQP